MSEQRVFTRTEIVDLLGINETLLRDIPTDDWRELTGPDSLAITKIKEHFQNQTDPQNPEPYKTRTGKLTIADEAELNQLIAFLVARNDEALRHQFMVEAQPPYPSTQGQLAAGAFAPPPAQDIQQQQAANQNPQRPSNNEAIVNHDIYTMGVKEETGYYQYDAFKNNFKAKLTADEARLCDIKEGTYKSLDDLKADTEMWNLLTPQQKEHYESKANERDFYPVDLFVCKTKEPTGPEEARKIGDIQKRFSDMHRDAKNMEVPWETMGEKVSNMFRPGR